MWPNAWGSLPGSPAGEAAFSPFPGKSPICPTLPICRQRRQSSRMSASRSLWVCTKTSLAPGAAAASSLATRALRYFCCVATTIKTSQCGSTRRSRASVVSAVGCEPAGPASAWLSPPARRSLSLALRASGASVVSGSGQSTSTKFAKEGESCWTRSTSLAGMPSISAVSPGRQRMTGRRVVGRSRPVRTSSTPAKALISALLPVPLPPKVATISGDSSLIRRLPSRRVSRSTIARHVSAGRHIGAERDNVSSRWAKASISPRSSRWFTSEGMTIG